MLAEAQAFQTMRLLSYCVMPNHWHLVLWPAGDGELSEFMRWLTLTHTQRYHAFHGTSGTGPLYQGRFKSFPVQSDRHLFTVRRYVERNPLRAGLVRAAEDWQWSSLWRRVRGDAAARVMLSSAAPLPANWLARVNEPPSDAELAAIRTSVKRGQPFGEPAWQRQTAARLSLESAFRARGRPKR